MEEEGTPVLAVNGKTKLWISAAALFAVISAAFVGGATYTELRQHVEDKSKHETASEKQIRIDRSNEPLAEGIKRNERKLDELDKKINRLLERG